MTNRIRILLRLSLFGLAGSVAGFAYYYFIGCSTGSCPITSNWKITTIYGLVSGLIIGIPTKKKTNNE
jgi:hypothetical protein